MTKRLHRCIACEPKEPETPFERRRGFTRHDDRVCAQCRSEGVNVRHGLLYVPLTLSLGGRSA